MQHDRPDVVITEPFGAVAGTVAEKYDVPFLLGATMPLPSPRAGKKGIKAAAPLTLSIVLDETNPTWLLKAAYTFYCHMGTIVSEVLTYRAHWKLNEIRRSHNQEPLDNLIHLFTYYPILSLLG